MCIPLAISFITVVAAAHLEAMIADLTSSSSVFKMGRVLNFIEQKFIFRDVRIVTTFFHVAFVFIWVYYLFSFYIPFLWLGPVIVKERDKKNSSARIGSQCIVLQIT